jgi:hypothetical protein
VVAGFGEERGVAVLTRGDGGGVRTAAADITVEACPFITGHSVTEGRRPSWLIGTRHVATQRPIGGPHVSAKFQFLEISENKFPHNKNR